MLTIFHSTARSSILAELSKFKSGSWVHAVSPTDEELETLAQDFNLEIDLLNDALDLYEAPRVEVDGDCVYVYTRYYHVDESVINATEPVLFVYHPECLITVLRLKSDIFQRHITGVGDIVTTQRTKMLLQFLTAINSSYQDYLNKVTRRILSVRTQLKRTDINSQVLLDMVENEDDLNEILSALQPQAVLLRSLLGGKYIRLYEEDRDLIEDLSLGTGELIELVKSRLKTIVNIRQAYDALATADLNRTFKRLTSISIFLMVPAIMVGLYGMNILLPWQNSKHAFWIVLIVTALLTLVTVAYFNKKRWL